MTMRLPHTVLLASALALACARAPVTDTSAPKQALFVPDPSPEAAAARDPHDFKGKALCQRCHFPDGKLTAGPNAVCTACHRFGHGNHPVDVIQKADAHGLPLLADRKVACHTCHDPHSKKSVLRKPFNELCTSCHGKH
jgi:predicted CXXCH cytochrome family protein